MRATFILVLVVLIGVGKNVKAQIEGEFCDLQIRADKCYVANLLLPIGVCDEGLCCKVELDGSRCRVGRPVSCTNYCVPTFG